MLKIGRHVGAAALFAISGLALISSPAQAQLGLGSLIVTMTSPASGATVSGTVPVSASVSIIGLITVRGVQFKLDGANLGAEDTSSPYSVSWNTTGSGNGSHTLRAVARDLLGVQYTSDPVTVTVSNAAPPPPPPPADTTPPAVRITSPSDGQTISGTVALTASASDNVGVVGVQFQLDGINGGAEARSAPYSVSFDTTTTSDGAHTITAVARDAAGNRSTSAPVTVTVSNVPPPPPADTTPPAVSITSPSNGATISGTVTVTASASDNVGVAGVQFQLDGVNSGAEDTTAPYSISFDTTTTSNGSHTITAVARDAAGNRSTSAPVTVTVANNAPPPPPPPPPPGSTTRFQETDPSIAYTAGWTPDGSLSWSGGTAAFSTTTGAQATFTFTGPSVTWIGGRAAGTGIARISVDGVFLTEVDTYSKTVEVRVPMFQATGLSNARHTLTIEVTGRQNAAATGTLIVVDAFDVPAAAVSRLQETDPSISYSAGTFVTPDWMPFDTSRIWSAGFATLSKVPGAQATITFTGTGISWIGARGPQTGIARVMLDGVALPPIDTYSPTEQIQAEMFTKQDLADTSHILTVQVTGEQNAASTSPLIVVDGFEVTMSGTRHQDTDPAIAYGPNWIQDNRDKAYSEGASAESNIVGAQATITFTGTGIRWIGARGPQCGIARIFLDGAFVEDFDTYFQTEGPQHADFFRGGLAPGTHTLSIQVMGKNPLSTDFWILIDAFDVIP
jgi:Bacterial Ig domain